MSAMANQSTISRKNKSKKAKSPDSVFAIESATPTSTSTEPSTSSETAIANAARNDVIDLCESDSEDEKAFVCKRLKNQFGSTSRRNCNLKVESEVKVEGVARFPQILDISDDDEIEIVEKAKPTFATTNTASAKTTGEDDDVEMVGFIGDRLPHSRCHCTEMTFEVTCIHTKSHQAVQASLETNKKRCDLCYCYVCDKPASECKTWAPTTEGTTAYTSNAHCMAFDKGFGAQRWKMLRHEIKNPGSRATSNVPFCTPNGTGLFYDSDHEDGDSKEDDVRNLSPYQLQRTLLGRVDHLSVGPVLYQPQRTHHSVGPFAPDYKRNMDHDNLTKCRKCGWFSRLLPTAVGTVSCRHWCHKCGRVVSENFLLHPPTWTASRPDRRKSSNYKKNPSDVLVGEKIIPFTIQAHDPRQITAFKKSWQENEGDKWTYNEAQMQDDAFRQRFGVYVRPANILECVPIVEKVPIDGRFASTGITDSAAQEGQGSSPAMGQCASISETEAVLLESQNHIAILRELDNFESFGLSNKSTGYNSQVAGNVQANWDQNLQKGTFKVTLYLRPTASANSRTASLTKLLGAWFGAFPYSLAELAPGFTAKESTFTACTSIPLPPFWVTESDEKVFLEEMSDDIKEAMDSFNAAAVGHRSNRSLLSSSGEHFVGGTTSSTPGDFASFLKGYFTNMLVDDLARKPQNKGWSWLAKKCGAIAAHRRMRSTSGYSHTSIFSSGQDSASASCFESYLSPSEYPLAFENLCSDVNDVRAQTRTLEALVQSLENLGHARIPAVEGLTVELLDFQKESVQWALEREQQEGGVQSFLWVELPSVSDNAVDKLYLNPVLNRVSAVKPKLVRGGLICEEMGLGKTIISLALILSNPAPTLPMSGSDVPDKFDAHDGAGLGWDPDLKTRIDESAQECTKRGSILSRGTLVVCHVSLVGQWCEEAKSKLQDPGLIYPYHGSNRKRNPKLLAENSIVVTTYATLSSDKNYHAKGQGLSYSPPCEQVRWWRIICDESHTMRTASTKQSHAVASLVSDHTWCVTGTPVSTSLNDLSNQLKLVGIENVTEYFEIFGKTVMKTINDRSKAKDRGRLSTHRPDNRLFGHFLFFIRNLMIRHTKTQKYLGTDTDLMALPAKTERTIEVTLTDDERVEYTALETEAKDFYNRFKLHARKELSKYYLQLSSALKAQRVAMSGGHAPLTAYDDLIKSKNNKGDESDSEQEEADNKRKKNKKEAVAFSEFAYTSKLKKLIQELKRVRDEEPDSKSLVFSNFSSTLKWLQEELPKESFTFRHINGQMPQKKRAEALAAFQNDPPTTVFLLSMISSNCGINLTSANRVFLLEPSMNPAAVQQAIGRVHRLGQKRKVEIIRMIVKDSIETRLTRMLDKRYTNETSVSDENEIDLVASKPSDSFLGSLSSDRTTVLTKEFDLLFGVDPDGAGG